MNHSPRRHVVSVFAVAGAFAFFLAACWGQHDPRPDWQREAKEQSNANQPLARLTDTGEIPAADAGKGPSIGEKYTTYCGSCHGATGHGDGPAGAALTPKPRNFHDGAWQAKSTDEHIFQTIKGGGASVGLSPMMAPWGGVLSDDEIKEMVAHIRTFKEG